VLISKNWSSDPRFGLEGHEMKSLMILGSARPIVGEDRREIQKLFGGIC